MSLLSVVQDVCAVVGVLQPTSVFASLNTNRTMQEMLTLANEVAQRVAYDTREWTQMKAQATFTGDGVKTAFDMPVNYLRMLTSSNVWRSTSNQQPMTFIADTDEWLRRRAANLTDAWGEWTLLGTQMLIQPVMGVGVTAKFPYLDRNCVLLASPPAPLPGTMGERFVSDDDVYRLPERLLKLGMIWQWRAQKGAPYAEDLGSFGDALAMLMGSNKPAPIIVGNTTLSATVKTAYPWPTPNAPVWPP